MKTTQKPKVRIYSLPKRINIKTPLEVAQTMPIMSSNASSSYIALDKQDAVFIAK